MDKPEQDVKADRLLTLAETAAIMRVTKHAVYRWARQGILRPVRLPGRKQNLGYLASDIRDILNPRPRPSAQPPGAPPARTECCPP